MLAITVMTPIMNMMPSLTMISAVALMPIVNRTQHLVGLMPGEKYESNAELLLLLQNLSECGFFNMPAPVDLFLQIAEPGFLSDDLAQQVDASRVVLCIADAAFADVASHSKLKDLTSQGFRILIDDVSTKVSSAWHETMSVSVDCSAGIPIFARAWLSKHGGGLHLAKNVSTQADLSLATDAGFKLFSGDFPLFPAENARTNDAGVRVRLIKLLDLVSRDADSSELEELIKQDATLTFMLFKLVSSAAFAQTVKVSSFGKAINLLGRRQLQRWLQLLLYARQRENGPALNPLMLRAAFRASFMEAICREQGGSKDQQDCAFMVGMFSLLDKLFGIPLDEVIRPLNLTDEVLDALLRKIGLLGEQLHLAEILDSNKAGELGAVLTAMGVDSSMCHQCQIMAYGWANQVCQEV